jgi:hypothetical protein
MNRFLCNQNVSIFQNATAYQFSQKLNDISTYVLPLFALAGNSLTLIVILTNPQLNRLSFSAYVKSMAVTDTLALLFKFLSYINKTSKTFYLSSMCTILIFCAESSVLLSIWTIVLITIERTLVVIFPLHIKKLVSASRARILILIIAILTLIFSSRVLIIPIDTSIGQRKHCHPASIWWLKYRQINVTITEFAYCYIPLAIVMVGNFLTTCTVAQAVNRRHDLLTNKSYQQKRKMESNKNQLMVMLLIVTLMFIVYFVPFTITNVVSRWGLPFGLCFTPKSFEIYFVLRSLSELLKDLNFCTNFIIYCVSGRRFRCAFFSLFEQHQRQASVNSRNFETLKNRSEFTFKKKHELKIIALFAKNTSEDS